MKRLTRRKWILSILPVIALSDAASGWSGPDERVYTSVEDLPMTEESVALRMTIGTKSETELNTLVQAQIPSRHPDWRLYFLKRRFFIIGNASRVRQIVKIIDHADSKARPDQRPKVKDFDQMNQPTPTERDLIRINLPDSEVSDVAQFYGWIGGMKVTLDNRSHFSDPISIVATKSLPRKEALDFIERALLLQGFAIIEDLNGDAKIIIAAST